MTDDQLRPPPREVVPGGAPDPVIATAPTAPPPPPEGEYAPELGDEDDHDSLRPTSYPPVSGGGIT
ncbi:hypothetical protein Cch01nite_20270 [Cellulomonas chitinilytica]|uniref:Uncharacterized protein n=1 Tax=Cellulomonas chitinilytica TaxID=398759 RepID=A0A919P0Z7_9CELL|nr:hypothetical protein [Cellulomonas chitinilytica]GIG21303.1 hypothetical protein Cch01nite_20270 [Cellulomonas chitinilytica]